MESLNTYIAEYKRQLEKGMVKKAYQGIMNFLMKLRVHLQKEYPDNYVSGSLYQGYMDMSYIAFIPPAFKARKLKIAIVFNHETIAFEVWLCGFNKKIQQKYWDQIKADDWNKYTIPASLAGKDSIVEHIITSSPDFDNPDQLKAQIEKEILLFAQETEKYLS